MTKHLVDYQITDQITTDYLRNRG